MAGMVRKLMRGIRHSGTGARMAGGAVSVGSVRAGMHQKSEHEFARAQMDAAPVPQPMEEDPEELVDAGTPPEAAAEIPPEPQRRRDHERSEKRQPP